MRADIGRVLAVGAAAALAVGVAAVSVGTVLGGDARRITVVPDAVALIEPEKGAITASVATARQPIAVASDGRDLWVTSYRDSVVHRLDGKALRARARLKLADPPGGIAATAGALWVRTEKDVLRIDAARGRVTARIPLGASPGLAVAAGGGAVWAVANSRLYRIDPARNAVARAYDLAPQRLLGVRYAAGAVWVNGPRRPAIVRVDPASGARRQYRLPRRAGSWDVGFGSLWVGTPERAAVTRIDAWTGRVVSTIAVGPDPRGVAVGAGAVWVAADDGLWRIDPRTNRARHLSLRGAPAAALAAPFPAGDQIWVTVW